MKHRNAIFFDIDGTIIDADGLIPESAVQAIHAARRSGAACIINTGRPFSHVDPAVKAIGFDGYICSCGQHILLGDKTVLRQGFPPDLRRQITDTARRCRMDVVYEAEEGIWFDLCHPPLPVIADSRLQFARRGFDVTHSVDAPDFTFDKLCAFPQPDSDTAQFLDALAPHCTVIFREGGMLEIIRKGCSKQEGVLWAARRLALSLEQCFAIGDSTNDLPMLTCVPHSIAMGNAPDEVKAAAEYITDDLHRDGLALALAHYGLTTP